MNLNLGIFSINHKNAKVDFREKVAFNDENIKSALYKIKATEKIETVIISTCNRVDIVLYSDEEIDLLNFSVEFYMDFFNVRKSDILNSYEYNSGEKALDYLFQLALGLDSVVFGEDQILGQIKKAHELSMKLGASHKVLNKLFLHLIYATKKIKTKTKLSENPLSVSYIAVKKSKEFFKDLKDRVALVLGFGEISRITVKHLLEEGVKKVYILNRKETIDYNELDKLKASNKIIIEDYMNKYSILKEVDILITGTSAPHYIYDYEEFKDNLSLLKSKVFMIDIAVPRDIDPKIGCMENVKLLSIDELKDVSNKNLMERKKILKDILKDIKIYIEDFIKWYNSLPIHPKIKEIQLQKELFLKQEIENIFKKVDTLDVKEKEEIERYINIMMNKIIKRPIGNLKKLSEMGHQDLALDMSEAYLDLLDRSLD